MSVESKITFATKGATYSCRYLAKESEQINFVSLQELPSYVKKAGLAS